MKRDYYAAPKPTRLMRILWSAAGGDRFILERSTYSDQVKYMCLGGIIAATGIMAAIAGGYAFYTIFSPKGDVFDAYQQVKGMTNAVKEETHIPTALMSIIFGILWGGMIFNLDRFIVSSTGKGDGTEAITWEELKGALPRIIMGAIIALTISKPVEIRMFKSEIDVALHEAQMDKIKATEIKTREISREKIALIDKDLAKLEIEKHDIVQRIKSAEKEYTDQLQGRAGAPAGDGKLAKALLTVKESLINDLNNFNAKNQARMDTLMAQKNRELLDVNKKLSQNAKVASGLDGLLERIKLAHKVSVDKEGDTPWISIFITLLFLAIELTPIFFKLMLTKTPYDYFEENIKELMKAEEGILVDYNYYKDKKGQERDLVVFYEKEKLNTERKSLLKAQSELTEYAIQKYTEEMKRKIDENPSQYVKSKDL